VRPFCQKKHNNKQFQENGCKTVTVVIDTFAGLVIKPELIAIVTLAMMTNFRRDTDVLAATI